MFLFILYDMIRKIKNNNYCEISSNGIYNILSWTEEE